MGIRKALSNNLKKHRRRRGWSQEKLAEESGLHRTYVSGVERGDRNPTIEVIAKLAKALGVRPFDLLKDAE
jgi:transcriptional regulator with XRE-family HTH domain